MTLDAADRVAIVALVVILGALVLDRLGLLEEPTHGPGSTHGSTHAPVPGNVTHETLPVPTSHPITPGGSSHGSSHAIHGPGAVTFSPPSSWGET